MKINWKRTLGISALVFYVCLFSLLVYRGLCACGHSDGYLRKINATSLEIPVSAQADQLQDAQSAWERLDYQTAVKLLRPLADQGNADAQNDLGLMYEHGHGVPQDYLQAYMWYHRAAKQGNPRAQEELGRILTDHPDVKQDWDEAYFWFSLAMTKLNGPVAVSYEDARGMARAKQRLTPEQIKAVERRVRDWKPTPEQPPAPAATTPPKP